MTCYNVNMNNYIELQGLPKIEYAHSFSADKYYYMLSAKHSDCVILETAYILEGTLTCTFPNGQTVDAPPHSVLCNFNRENLKVHADSKHEHHTVCFAVPLKYTNESNPNGLCIPFVTKLPPGKGKILSLIDEIIFAHTVHIRGDMTYTGLFLQLLDEINKHNRQTSDMSAYLNYKYVKKAKEYIFDHLNEAICQTDIASHLEISPEYLCSVFKKSEGMPIIQFINKAKLEQIRNLMKNNGITLARASELYGYQDPNYVSRLHKKYFNYNITDFKKNM